MALIDTIKKYQNEGINLSISFKDGSRIYIEENSEVKRIDDDFYHFKADISLGGKVNTIRNIREIKSLDPLEKKIPNREGPSDGQERR